MFVSIPGKSAHAMARKERWLEVWIGDMVISVITRQQDSLTNSIARGLAQHLCRRLGGRLEEPT